MFRSTVNKLALLSTMICLMILAAPSMYAQKAPVANMLVRVQGTVVTINANTSSYDRSCSTADYTIDAVNTRTGQSIAIHTGTLATLRDPGDGGIVVYDFAANPGLYDITLTVTDCNGSGAQTLRILAR